MLSNQTSKQQTEGLGRWLRGKTACWAIKQPESRSQSPFRKLGRAATHFGKGAGKDRTAVAF